MAGFDDPGLYYYDRFNDNAVTNELDDADANFTIKAAKRRFKEFLRTFHRGGFTHVYREQLTRKCNIGEFWLEVDFCDLRNFDEELADKFRQKPTIMLSAFEEAAKEVADEITRPRPEDEKELPDIQVIFKSDKIPQAVSSTRSAEEVFGFSLSKTKSFSLSKTKPKKSLKSSQVSQLTTISGIIIGASQVRSKATHISIQCRSCKQIRRNIPLKAGLDLYQLPRVCASDQSTLAQKCPVDPYFIVPDKCACVDFQILKLQESPEDVPHGEMPRHLQLYASRYLTDKVTPGNKVTVTGIYSIKRTAIKSSRSDNDRSNSGLRFPYVRLLGIEVETSGLGRTAQCAITLEEEEYF
uniref:DNA replication licensing factor MCM5 n=1 Tax=Romanomermis culicivorax TaxID=13658 RepID=A0A915KMJ9_ROMCU